MMDKEKIIKQVKRIVIASNSLRKCLSAIDYMIDNKMTRESDLYHVLITGIVVSYGRNFVKADGLGRLPEAYSSFPIEGLREVHEFILNARNTLYAHRDMLTHGNEFPMQAMFTRADANDISGLNIKVGSVEIAEEGLSNLGALFSFQLDRLEADYRKTVPLILESGKKYRPNHVYNFGVDFP